VRLMIPFASISMIPLPVALGCPKASFRSLINVFSLLYHMRRD
jgi:hypothetical protein